MNFLVLFYLNSMVDCAYVIMTEKDQVHRDRDSRIGHKPSIYSIDGSSFNKFHFILIVSPQGLTSSLGIDFLKIKGAKINLILQFRSEYKM